MKLSLLFFAGLSVSLLAGCQSNAHRAAIETRREPVGFLKIYSATQAVRQGEIEWSYPHTGYTIYRSDGRFFKYVRNHVGEADEVPMPISLPTGSYVIKAEDEAYGHVRIPIEVRVGRSITIDLERNWPGPPPAIPNADLIRTSKGRVVGWVIGIPLAG